jgi:hypothetical protein
VTCSYPGQVWRQPPETAQGAPEALRSPGLVTQAPTTLSLIGYYSIFMKPSRLLSRSWIRHLQLHFAITSPWYLSWHRSEISGSLVPNVIFSFCLKYRCYASSFLFYFFFNLQAIFYPLQKQKREKKSCKI